MIKAKPQSYKSNRSALQQKTVSSQTQMSLNSNSVSFLPKTTFYYSEK